jgi:hypothetical protein
VSVYTKSLMQISVLIYTDPLQHLVYAKSETSSNFPKQPVVVVVVVVVVTIIMDTI